MLIWTKLNVNHVVRILYSVHWHPGPQLKVCDFAETTFVWEVAGVAMC